MIRSFLSEAKKNTIDIYPIGIINLPTIDYQYKPYLN